jgi:hypothetical protein
MTERSEAKKCEAKLCVKNLNQKKFDAKLRFALFDNFLVTYQQAGVGNFT